MSTSYLLHECYRLQILDVRHSITLENSKTYSTEEDEAFIPLHSSFLYLYMYTVYIYLSITLPKTKKNGWLENPHVTHRKLTIFHSLKRGCFIAISMCVFHGEKTTLSMPRLSVSPQKNPDFFNPDQKTWKVM